MLRLLGTLSTVIIATGASSEERFENYVEIFDSLLSPGIDDGGGTTGRCRGLGLPLVEGRNDTSSLGNTLADMCGATNRDQNFTSGATLGAGFSSPFATRTYVPINFGTLTTQTASDREKSGFRKSSFSFIDRYQSELEGLLSFGVLESPENEFSPSTKEIYTVSSLSYSIESRSNATFGISLELRDSETTSDATFLTPNRDDLVLYFEFEEEPFEVLERRFRDACEGIGSGQNSSRTTSIAAFTETELYQNTKLTLTASAYSLDSDYDFPLCLYSFADGSDEFRRGVISGSPNVYGGSIRAQLSNKIAYRGISILPRIGVELARERQAPYKERETSPTSTADLEADDNVGSFGLTGGSIAYDESVTNSVQGNIGLSVFAPLAVEEVEGGVWLDLNHVREFGDQYRTLSGRLVDDMRSEPTEFSYTAGRVAQSGTALSMGVDIPLGRNGGVFSLYGGVSEDSEGRIDRRSGFTVQFTF